MRPMQTSTLRSLLQPIMFQSLYTPRVLVLACIASLWPAVACSDAASTPSSDAGAHSDTSGSNDEPHSDGGSNPRPDGGSSTSNDEPRPDGGSNASDEPRPDGGSSASDPAPTNESEVDAGDTTNPTDPATSGDASIDTSNDNEDAGASTQDPAPSEAKARFFLPTPEVDNTGAPHLSLDKAGGLHTAYPTYVGKGAYYAYCDAACSSEADVKVVRFETEMTVLNALVAVTDDGRPRVLLNSWDRIYYAECDEDCTEQTSWSIGAILKHDNKKEITGEAFALDPDGNPAFILHSYVELFGVGQEVPATHFAWCGGDCTNTANWIANKLADENWEGGALRFDDDGGAHLFAAEVTYEVGVPKDRIPVYASCASHCEDGGATWSSLSLNYPAYEDRNKAVSMRPALSLELTSDGAPRVLAMLNGEAEDERWITYMACDQDCTASGESWAGTVVSNNPNIAAGLDLALDANDRPRMVYNLGYSIFYAACDTGLCTNESEEWQISPVELAAEMDPDEVILWPNCNVDAWFLHSPNVVLDADGKARVGYQAADMSGGGVPDPDPNQTPCMAGLDMTWTRLTAF